MAAYPERDPQAFNAQVPLHDDLTDEEERKPPLDDSFAAKLFRVPWWALILALIGIFVYTSIAASEDYSRAFEQVSTGIEITIRVTFFSYAGALVIGLFIAVVRSTTPKPQKGLVRGTLSVLHLLLHNFVTFFLEVMRGLPILVVLLLAAYIITPEFRDFMLDRFDIRIPFRGQSVETCIIALSMAYGAFISEIFRSGIESIEKGQREAAKSLGMNNWQTMRLIVLPQAFRRVLPPLGNDFIAMIKDSSLVGYIGVLDVTQSGYLWAGSSFQFLETYLTIAVIYLTMTLIGSILVRGLENYLRTEER